MKRIGFHSAPAIFAAAGIALAAVPANARTDVSINVGVPAPVVVAPAPVVVAPQPVYVAEPPEMVFVPSLGVHFAPAAGVDLFFQGNFWWSHRGDRWYRADGYNGPWVAVGTRHVPHAVYRMPPNYRTVYVHERRMPYGQWKKAHWKHGGKRHDGGRYEGRHGGGRPDRYDDRREERHGGGHGGRDRHRD